MQLHFSCLLYSIDFTTPLKSTVSDGFVIQNIAVNTNANKIQPEYSKAFLIFIYPPVYMKNIVFHRTFLFPFRRR